MGAMPPHATCRSRPHYVDSGTVPLSNVPDADGVSPAAWLAHTITSGVEPATGAASSRVSARTAPGSPFPPGARVATGRLSDLLDALAEHVDIAVSSVVTRVAYDDDRVSLRLDSGESLTADRAIVTVPLGVLKSDTLRFSPALPSRTSARSPCWNGRGRRGVAAVRGGVLAPASGGRRPATATRATGTGDLAPDVLTSWARRPGRLLDGRRRRRRATGEDDEGGAVLVGVIAATQAPRLEALDDSEFLSAILVDLAPFATAPG